MRGVPPPQPPPHRYRALITVLNTAVLARPCTAASLAAEDARRCRSCVSWMRGSTNWSATDRTNRLRHSRSVDSSTTVATAWRSELGIWRSQPFVRRENPTTNHLTSERAKSQAGWYGGSGGGGGGSEMRRLLWHEALTALRTCVLDRLELLVPHSRDQVFA